MGTELIKISWKLARKINEILEEKMQFTPRIDEKGSSYEFTRDELALIDKLEFEEPIGGTLEGIELLPNLRSLTVKSEKKPAFLTDSYVNSISNKDSDCIAKCKNLKNLTIENQARISSIDVTKMEHLHALSINNNDGLEEIFGLDSLKELWAFDCFGNERLTQIKGLDSMIMQNQELTDLNLDLLLFPDAVGYDVKSGKLNEMIIKKLNHKNVTWRESLTKSKSIKISNEQMMDMHKKAIAVLEEYLPKHCKPKEAVIGIDQYLAENVKYADESKETEPRMHSGKCGTCGGPVYGINGAFNAFMFNECVCEGYTRAMQYLLRLKGIKSRNVTCFGVEDTLQPADKHLPVLPNEDAHSIILIEDDYCYLYDDPCWNACVYQEGNKAMPWTLLTREEISRDHMLAFSERVIDNFQSIPRKVVQSLIQDNIRFRTERAEKRDKTFSEQKIGETTVNVSTGAKDNAGKRLERDKRQIRQNDINGRE